MLFSINSTNEQFSYCINKNPASPPKFSECRKGYLVGYYSSNSDYHVAFIEGADEVSFGYSDEVDYLSPHKFCSPLIPLQITKSFFSLSEEHDKVSLNRIEVSGLNVKDRTSKTITKYLPNVFFNNIGVWQNYKNLTIEETATLSETITKLELVCLFTAIDNGYYIDISENLLKKYFKKIADIDAPYFFRYLLKTNLIRNSGAKFEHIENYLNESQTHNYSFSKYGNAEARVKFCEPFIDKIMLDIGCGEGRYLTRFANRCDRYICVDTDEDVLETAKRKAQNKGIENCEFYNSFDEFLDVYNNERITVLCTEVLEHMSLKSAKKFIKQITSSINYKRALFTTPNVDFNQFYKLEDCGRHDDHQFEISKSDFVNMVKLNAKCSKLEVADIGDVVDNTAPTTGVILYGSEQDL